MKNLQIPELNSIERSEAEQIKKTFEPMVEMLSNFEKRYNELVSIPDDEITLELTKEFKKLRIEISKPRIEAGKVKDKLKEYSKLRDKAIMGVHNILVWAVKEKEDILKQKENIFEIREKKKLEDLQIKRQNILSDYVEDAHDRDLSKFEEEEFEALLSMKKKQYEDRLEAERIAEEQRIKKQKAEEEERLRIIQENAKLKAEAEERERLAKVELEKRKKEEQERKAKEEAELKIKEEEEKKVRAEYEAKITAEREAREKIEREEKVKREKLEAELKAKKEAELKAKKEEEERVQFELNKDDDAKIKSLIADFQILKTKYTFKSEKNKVKYSEVSLLIDKTINHIEK